MTQPNCDDYLDDKSTPTPLRRFLRYSRWPAYYQFKAQAMGIECPTLFADYNGNKVRVVMASRFGDVGITSKLDDKRGYEYRVAISELSCFSEE